MILFARILCNNVLIILLFRIHNLIRKATFGGVPYLPSNI
jgi:hypothetical protein